VYFNAALLLRTLMARVPWVAVRYNALLRLLCPDMRGGAGANASACAGAARPQQWQRGVRNRMALSLAMLHSAMLGLPREQAPEQAEAAAPFPAEEVWRLLARWKAELLEDGQAWHARITLSRLQALAGVLAMAAWTLRRDYGLKAGRELLQGLGERFETLAGDKAALAALDARLDVPPGAGGRPSEYVKLCIARLLRPGGAENAAQCLATLPAFLKPTEWLVANLEAKEE
jgi:hypothetical protein